MSTDHGVNRRRFLGGLGAGALLGALDLPGAPAPSGWTPAPVLKNPNILIVMVDQMRLPVWLSPSQVKQLNSSIMPNILGRLQANSYNFGQHFCAATNCTSSRSTLLTGLYVPQTAMYITGDSFGGGCVATMPALNPAYPTWGAAVPQLNPAYSGNMWWFGKWHLSANLDGTPLQPYGFNTRTYPGGPAPYNPSPNGFPNEGSSGGTFNGVTLASDAQITTDFLGWLQGQAPTSGEPATPWCATVSLINPHDIAQAPAWLSGPIPPSGVPLPCYYFPLPPGKASSLYTSTPSHWNYEDLTQVLDKPSFQYTFQASVAKGSGTVTSWTQFLNDYFWLQHLVDKQVGLILDALSASPFASNTVVVFLADHGEYAGSHGLHDKGGAVYDESLHVPLFVQFPGQTGSIYMQQMCSGVDFFGLICDLAASQKGQWRRTYPDLANRQSLWSFLHNNSSETRVAPSPVGLPYVLHTFDENSPSQTVPATKNHIVGFRTKLDQAQGAIGGKLAYYWEWGQCSILPNSTPPDGEFYDYNPATTNNTSEMGNDFYSKDTAVQTKIGQYTQVLGSWGSPSTGLIGSELSAPLVGTGTNGQPLSEALATAQAAYLSYISEGTCG
jgi:arylsulfatase A-like enzyme